MPGRFVKEITFEKGIDIYGSICYTIIVPRESASIEWGRPRTTGLRSPQKNLLKPLDKSHKVWYNKDVDREEPSKDAIWMVRA